MSSTMSARAVRSSMKLCGMRPAMRGILRSGSIFCLQKMGTARVFSAQDRDHHEQAEHQRQQRPADDQRQATAGEFAQLTPFGFDLATDGDADERDEDQRAGGGEATAAQINRRAWL